jgi:hypothetical protein
MTGRAVVLDVRKEQARVPPGDRDAVWAASLVAVGLRKFFPEEEEEAETGEVAGIAAATTTPVAAVEVAAAPAPGDASAAK